MLAQLAPGERVLVAGGLKDDRPERPQNGGGGGGGGRRRGGAVVGRLRRRRWLAAGPRAQSRSGQGRSPRQRSVGCTEERRAQRRVVQRQPSRTLTRAVPRHQDGRVIRAARRPCAEASFRSGVARATSRAGRRRALRSLTRRVSVDAQGLAAREVAAASRRRGTGSTSTAMKVMSLTILPVDVADEWQL